MMWSKNCLPLLFPLLFSGCSPSEDISSTPAEISWTHLFTIEGDLKAPNGGNQQTSSAVFDVDRDGVNDFLIAERTAAPAVVWYRRTNDGWDRLIVEPETLSIEAGSAVSDIDGDGDLDVVFAGDSSSNQVWWWQNPCPDYTHPGWKRHLIKDSGKNKHHDQIFGDFDGDGWEELVIWNQGENHLLLFEVPELAQAPHPWESVAIYRYTSDSEPLQRGEYPGFKGVHEHEGLAKADINGDGKLDIVGGGRWFEHISGSVFRAHPIDPGYTFTRAAAGQLIKGGRPEVVLVVGDGTAPLILYEWDGSNWREKILIDSVRDGHSLDLIDFDRDGNLDIFLAEMRLGNHPDAKTRILLGNGEGKFTTHVVSTGFGLHESRISDLDGDGDLDILGKPYTWEAPRLDIWINTQPQHSTG